LRREGKVIASVAACAVGATMSLLLLVIMYTERQNDGNTNRTTNLLISSNVHYAHLGGDNNVKPDSIPIAQSVASEHSLMDMVLIITSKNVGI